MKKIWLSVALASSSLLLTACNDDHDDTSVVVIDDGIPKHSIVNPLVLTPKAYVASDMSATAAESVIMTYKMLGVNGNEVQATSLLFTPKTAPPITGWPIVVWAHGTTGVADDCAPSQAALDTDVKKMIDQLLVAGYVVVAPDYEGLGIRDEVHPYLNLKSAAFSITDAVVAARSYLGNRVAKQWVTVGHSQGGHAALGAGEFHTRAQLDYRGTIAVAPASHLKEIFQLGVASVADKSALEQLSTYVGLNTYAALISAGMKSTLSESLYKQIFEPEAARIAESAEVACASYVVDRYAMEMYVSATNLDTLTGYLPQSNFINLPVIDEFLTKTSQPLTVQQNKPIIMYQGRGDTTVPISATNLLYYKATQIGNTISYRTDEAEVTPWDHHTVFTNNIEYIVNDVKTLMPIQ